MKHKMTEAEVREQFDELLEDILRILGSCENQTQQTAVYDWGYVVISATCELMERTFAVGSAKYARFYSGHVARQLRDKYREAHSGIANMDPEYSSVAIREVPEHLSICRSCGGTGKDAKTGLRECHYCEGTGRVRVVSVIRTMIRPYSPDDGSPPLEMQEIP